jgi:hypothetical protein
VTDADVYVVETPKGYTESFDARTVYTLERLGLIRHVNDGYALEDGKGQPVGALHHFYRGAHE